MCRCFAFGWVSRMLNPRPLHRGEKVSMSLDLSHSHMFAADTGKTLRT
jgi:multiple sugar transport system ATP-binding protein